jgi:hypothetical protein
LTVSTTNRRAGPFAGNDVTVIFPFVFRMFSAADLTVVSAADGIETELAQGVDYTAVLNADQNNSPGGQITLTAPLATGKTLVVTSDVPETQLTLITNAGGFFPKVFNAVFDKAVILVQQLSEKVGRSLRIPITNSTVTDLDIPVTPNAVLQWNAAGTALLAQTLPDLSLSLALPSQTGHNTHPLFSNGAAADWRAITLSDVVGATYLLATVQQLTANVSQNAQRSAQADAFALNAAILY